MTEEAERDIIIAKSKTLTFYFILMQLALHLGLSVSSGDPKLLSPHGVAFLHDFILILLVYLCIRLLLRITNYRFIKVAGFATAAIMLTSGMALSFYPQLLREYQALPTNIFSVDGTTAWVTVTQYLGIRRLWPVMLALLLGVAAYLRPVIFPVAPLYKYLIKGLVTLLTMAGLITLLRSPNPLINSLQQQTIKPFSGNHRVVNSLRQAPPRDSSIQTLAPLTPIRNDSKIDHIFLVVLEGVRSRDFEKNFLSKKTGFYQRVKNQAAWFSNYYSTNLDSYTSLIAMLTSEQVPYRSYADTSIYDHVNTASNLTRTLRSHGHYSLFISTYAYQPFVPTRNDWHRIMDRTDLASLDGWLSLGSSRMEQATEDMAALDTIVKTAADTPRSFILHELVYGHTTEWQARTGKSQLEYYDLYLNALLDGLERKGIASRSLLVIVSDHGDRARSYDAENYRVPLLVVGNCIKPATDKGFRTHLNLPAIIASYMNRTPIPAPIKDTFVIGSTERWIYGTITAEQQHLFIDDQTGKILSNSGNLAATTVHRNFQNFLDSFGRRFGR